MKSIIKDKCPACGYSFGFRGPSFRMSEKGSKNRKPLYFCPKCATELERVVPLNERILSTTGYVTLFIGSVMSVWKIVIRNEGFVEKWLIALYGVGIIGIGASIIFASIYQHYFLKQPSQEDLPESEVKHD